MGVDIIPDSRMGSQNPDGGKFSTIGQRLREEGERERARARAKEKISHVRFL